MLRPTILIMLILIPGAAQAADLPEALTYEGAPIPPHCLADWHETPVIDLADCIASEEIIPDAATEVLQPDTAGWVRQSFAFTGLEDCCKGWAAWRVLGHTRDGIAVKTLYNGGGSGTFSSVLTVRREENSRLRIVGAHAGGDRCNGGTAGAAVAGGALVIASWLTPGDVAGLALNAAGLPPLGDDEHVSWCASCCVGTLTEVDGEMAFVSLMAPTEGFASEPDTLQSCLDQLIFETGLRIFEQAALAAFGADFQARCRH